MRSVGPGRRLLGLALGAWALSLVAVPAEAMPMAPLATPAGDVVRAQFLGGPFFGAHGYYHPNPADRHYFYEGFDPSVYPPVKRWRAHRRWVRHRYVIVRKRY